MSNYANKGQPAQSVLLPVGPAGVINLTDEEINKEREFAFKKDKLWQEFRKVDKNSDAHISLEEWLDFAQKQVTDY